MAKNEEVKNARPAEENTPTPAPSETKPTPTSAPPTLKAPKFPVERLRQDCLKLFSVTTSTYDGATYNLEGEYAVEEMREHIKKWLNTPVPIGTRKERK